MIPQPRDSGSGSSRQPVFNAPPATIWLCGTLIACYLLYWLANRQLQGWALDAFAFVPIFFASQFEPGGPGLSLGGLLPLFTHAFLHADFLHLLLNVGFLLAFGSVVERGLGTWRFFVIFFLCSAAGALSEVVLTAPRVIFLIGASGAVYGMMGAVIPAMSRGAGRKRTLQFIAVIMALNLVLALPFLSTLLAGAEIAWRAHLGGFVTGIVVGYLLQLGARKPARR